MRLAYVMAWLVTSKLLLATMLVSWKVSVKPWISLNNMMIMTQNNLLMLNNGNKGESLSLMSLNNNQVNKVE